MFVGAIGPGGLQGYMIVRNAVQADGPVEPVGAVDNLDKGTEELTWEELMAAKGIEGDLLKAEIAHAEEQETTGDDNKINRNIATASRKQSKMRLKMQLKALKQVMGEEDEEDEDGEGIGLTTDTDEELQSLFDEITARISELSSSGEMDAEQLAALSQLEDALSEATGGGEGGLSAGAGSDSGEMVENLRQALDSVAGDGEETAGVWQTGEADESDPFGDEGQHGLKLGHDELLRAAFTAEMQEFNRSGGVDPAEYEPSERGHIAFQKYLDVYNQLNNPPATEEVGESGTEEPLDAVA